MRTYVYVDGFNLYYGAVKDTPFRWLNPIELVKQLIPTTHVIQKLKYFSARVSGAADPGAPKRQQIYFSALATVPEIEIHLGRFLSKTIWRPVVNFPVAGATIHSPVATTLPAGCHQVNGGTLTDPARLTVGTYGVRSTGRPLTDALVVEVHTMEEKGSDVNLGSHLLNDAWKGVFDAAVVISNDTDLTTPIRMVSVEQGKPVFVVCPGKWKMAGDLDRVATHRRHIRRAMLAAAQFPSPIPATTITRPAEWV